MYSDTKMAKARNMTALIEDARQKSYFKASNLRVSELETRLRGLRTEINTDLYARHLSNEDLDVLHRFYSSEAGNRILVAQQAISLDFQHSLRMKLRHMAVEFSHRINQ